MILYSLFYYLIQSGALAGGSPEIPQGFRAPKATRTNKSCTLILTLSGLCTNLGSNQSFKKPIHEIPSEEVFEEVSVNMAEEGDYRKTLGDFTVPTTASCGSSIVRPTVETNNFELKPALIHLIQQD
ncbi:hypothetical protein PIB30_097553 [Stylosanthes scabra]|uniref:Uncharacterized protein n=1 Tax=Stylosanthes scabra TaxID=79078 RepID=A0ABU6XVZ5_9FABA|nr:hypothetical protein [Stylosanthes scabra]